MFAFISTGIGINLEPRGEAVKEDTCVDAKGAAKQFQGKDLTIKVRLIHQPARWST